MSKSAIALSSRENSTIALKYEYKYCPSCGSAFSSSIRVTVELYEPELGFAGDLSRHYDYSDDVTCLRLLCDCCYEKGIFCNRAAPGQAQASAQKNRFLCSACA